MFLFGMFFYGCTNEDGTTVKGKVLFWKDAASSLGNVEVTITEDNTIDTVKTDYSLAQDCGTTGCFTYSNIPGVYHYTAAEIGTSKTWSGSVIIISNGCTKQRFN